MSLFRFLFFVFLAASTATAGSNTALPSCQAKCGDIDIPYPFGIGEGCYAQEYGDFSINCTANSMAFLSSSNIPVVDISRTGELRINGSTGYDCYDRAGKNDTFLPWTRVDSLPLTFSHTRNKLFVIGCDTFAYINGETGVSYTGGCISYCQDPESFEGIPSGSCSGLGCCGVSIPRGIKSYSTLVGSFFKYNNSFDFNHCGFVFLAEEGQYKFNTSDLSSDRLPAQNLPIVLDWSVGTQNCEQARKNKTVPYACRSSNSQCIDSNNGVGYFCNCSEGFQGNPYVAGGCLDIDECVQNPSICPSNATCRNNVGGYSCDCPKGYILEENSPGGCEVVGQCKANPCSADEYCENNECKSRRSSVPLGLKLGLGIGGGLLVLIAGSAFTCWGLQRRDLRFQTKKVDEFKKRMFEQNGGPLLQQHISSQPGNTFRIFTEEELAKATEGFADEQIIGRGGHGVVYFGKLEDNTAVAVKKSKMMDERESIEFAREMAILSQINHVNVVKILGCCVEVEVPMLVYEFVPGGTLYDLIHGRKGSKPVSLWVSLRIATEVAEALAYLHSYASPPIFHKDVKTSNVLLDENNKAKISDFGASSYVPVDETEIATVVQGTCGYLDPEYLQTYQFSDKSDVYSFGVVLVELLTRRKPLQLQGPEDQRGLAVTFVAFLTQGKLENILDSQIMEEGDPETLREIADLAGRCLSLKRADRPTMKDVSMALHLLGSTNKHSWVPQATPEDTESLLIREQSVACDSADVSNSYPATKYQALLDIEAGR